MFYFLVWGGILLLYSGSGQGRSGEAGQRQAIDRGDFDLGQDGVMRALDDLFSPSTIAKQNVINILGVRKKYCAYILCHPLKSLVYLRYVFKLKVYYVGPWWHSLGDAA